MNNSLEAPAWKLINYLEAWVIPSEEIPAEMAATMREEIGQLKEALANLDMPTRKQPMKDHPEDICQNCGTQNPSWFADNELFNKVNGSPNGILCPLCFQKEADALGITINFKADYVR